MTASGKSADEILLEAERRLSEEIIARVAHVLLRIPEIYTDRRPMISACARNVCLLVEMARLEAAQPKTVFLDFYASRWWHDRKPVAGAATDAFAANWQFLSGRKITRVLKKISGLKGTHHETGEFAALLGELFIALGIKAKPAGQVKLWKRREANSIGSPLIP